MLYINLFWSLLVIFLCFLSHNLIMRAINRTVSHVGKEIKAPKTISMIIGFLIYGFGIAIIMSIWNINLMPYLTGLGISGVVLGLAFQEPLTNFLSGVLVLVTRKVFEGEALDIDGISGVVDMVEMNHTRIKTFDGKMVLIPNRKVWSGTVTKFWPGPYRRVSFDVSVDYSSDLEKVISLLRRALEEEDLVVKDESVSNIVVFKEYGSSGITYTVYFWVDRENYFNAINALSARIKKIFEENNISIPYMIVDLRVSQKN
ncbi:mechanosensitive ion channel family protein [Dictyoglomus thermophilum]|uniref:Transporter, small conductance mechanosensitive ion channel (MscS) family n=2 Tax=Dictyoglomus thermophilum TaxID=14 RepID=B5YA86_DICT6|nr:mechanosensitive ion channel family protein [Dictyoglomus thermophilum]ACI18305.1 transporter, small conductance mechanosensitive ion channel (MscS) family [Dictyoglomus thermophilum H-6-12]TYT24453.1 mechanosensitive ion channel family protein [Dictyoglomus thermophilum]